METSAIAYRVADFLKQHPPFQSIEDTALRELAVMGRVRFFEANEYILWQGEPHKSYVFVIQQGTVSLWDDGAAGSALRDMRGPGDLLGVECFSNAPCCLYSATSSSDVVIYAFPTYEFERLVLAHPDARRFVDAYDAVAGVSHAESDAREPQDIALQQLIAKRTLQTCSAEATIQEVAQRMVTTGADAIALADGNGRLSGVATLTSLLSWAALGGGNVLGPALSGLQLERPPTTHANASVADAALALGTAATPALAVTADGSAEGTTLGLVTRRDIARVFGDEPASILREIRYAGDAGELRDLNLRARALVLRHLSDSTAVDWVGRFVSLADLHVVRRLLLLDGDDSADACWCFCGTAGRGESFTAHVPQLLVIAQHDESVARLRAQHDRLQQALLECGYASRDETPFDAAFHVATVEEWQTRYGDWLSDPVRTGMYLARPLFDLRAVHGDTALWSTLETVVANGIDPTFLLVLANDCLASMPPLTFFQNAVLDKSGEQTSVFKLEESALRPLVDVGRVFGLATKRVVGTSTVARLTHAATQHGEHDLIFAEAAETFRILLRQQARVGISQGTTGSELPPALLSRHDRHVLKSGFRSILALLEYTRGAFWLES